MNIVTRFLRLFDFEYQKSFRLAIYDLKAIIQSNNAKKQSDFNDFAQNNSKAISYINLLKNEFVHPSDVHEFIIKNTEAIIAKYGLTTRFYDPEDNRIFWREIFSSLDQIKPLKKREQASAELRLLLTISGSFGFGKPWLT